LRACFGLAAMYCFFYALAHLQLVEAMLLNFSAPLFIPLFALLWLRETLPPSVPWALGVGLLGIALILKPGIGILTPVALIGLISGVFAALAMVSVRSMSSTEPPERIVFYFSAMGTLVSGLPLLWSWHTPDLGQWGILLGIGVLATGGQVLLTRGITSAPAGQVGPFTYSTVVFATLLGWVAWGEMLDLVSLLGGLLVCAAGVLVLRGERTAGTMVSPRY
ncbi:MAG: DMT family transporter, partial [Candidatus Binatia bacterium]